MDVELSVLGEVVANNEGDLLHIKPSAPHVSGDEHSALSRPEFSHDSISLLLRHATVHVGHCEVGIAHLLGQPFHSTLLITEDNSLCDRESVV